MPAKTMNSKKGCSRERRSQKGVNALALMKETPPEDEEALELDKAYEMEQRMEREDGQEMGGVNEENGIEEASSPTSQRHVIKKQGNPEIANIQIPTKIGMMDLAMFQQLVEKHTNHRHFYTRSGCTVRDAYRMMVLLHNDGKALIKQFKRQNKRMTALLEVRRKAVVEMVELCKRLDKRIEISRPLINRSSLSDEALSNANEIVQIRVEDFEFGLMKDCITDTSAYDHALRESFLAQTAFNSVTQILEENDKIQKENTQLRASIEHHKLATQLLCARPPVSQLPQSAFLLRVHDFLLKLSDKDIDELFQLVTLDTLGSDDDNNNTPYL